MPIQFSHAANVYAADMKMTLEANTKMELNGIF